MASFSISAIYAEFDRAQTRTATFLASARNFRRAEGGAIHVRDVEEMAALALLKLTLAWESFLEDTFLRYLCGAKSSAGVAPVLLAPRQTTILAAFNTVRGSQRYLTWQADTAISRANKFLDKGAPYSMAVGGAKADLDEMAAVRNRIAHRSEDSVLRFRTVVRSHLTYVPTGMTPGRFLLRTLPAKGTTAIEHYASILRATAHLVANHK